MVAGVLLVGLAVALVATSGPVQQRVHEIRYRRKYGRGW
jgi:hypothetical protein